MIVTVRVNVADHPAFTLLKTGTLSVGSIIGSVLFHALLITFALWLAPYLAPDPGAIRIVPWRIELRIPADAFAAAPVPKTEKPAPAKTGEPKPAPAGSPAPKLVLPKLPPSQAKEVTILLPNLTKPPTITVEEIRAPSIISWTPPKAEPRKFVMPGARQVRPPDLQTPVPLSLDLPRDLPLVSDMAIAPLPNAPSSAKLPVQISATRPIKSFQLPPARSAPPAAPVETVVGDLASLVLLTPKGAQGVDRIRLPDGSQVAAIHATAPPPALPAPESAARPETAPGAEAGAGSGTDRSVDRTAPGAGGATASTRPQADTAAGVRTVAGGIVVTGGPVSGPGSGTAGSAGPAGLFAALALPAVPIRIEHPSNGVFDVVVVQSSTLNEFPGIAPLSGSPVYSVFLPVGRAKAWIMQFCVPKERAILKREGSVVQLGNPAPVKAPFPRVTISPPGVLGKFAIHGFLSDTGQFEELKALAGDKAAAETGIIPLLQQWMLRPATRDGKPVRIEVMLLISG